MIRLEIVANRSVEENLFEAFREEEVGKYYTKYPSVLGIGSTGPRMGDSVWPEENFALVIWCEEEEAQGIERAIGAVKKQFPDEGVKLFRPAAVINANPATLLPPPPEPPPKPVAVYQSYGPESENS